MGGWLEKSMKSRGYWEEIFSRLARDLQVTGLFCIIIIVVSWEGLA